MSDYPSAIHPSRVGSYSAVAKSGGGYVWDAVLEYRVWCSPDDGAADLEDGSDYYCALATYEEALACSQQTVGAKEPLALVLQKKCIDETEPGEYIHVKNERITEWPVEFLTRPRRDERSYRIFYLRMRQITGWRYCVGSNRPAY